MSGLIYKDWKQNTLLSAREKHAFVSGQFELTGRCNFDCKMCYVYNLINHHALSFRKCVIFSHENDLHTGKEGGIMLRRGFEATCSA